MNNIATPRSQDDIDAAHSTPVTPEEDARTVLINEVNWGAVLAGVALALAIQLILNMLGVALGAASVDPTAADNTPSAASFSVGAGLWWAVSGIIAAFAGGVAAGRLAGTPKETTAAWHGLISWSFTTLFVFYLLSSTASSIAGSAAQAVASIGGGMLNAAGGAVQTVASRAADPFASIEQAVRSAGGGQTDPAAARDAAIAAMRSAFTGDQGQAQAARDRAADALAKAQNIPADQARQQIQLYEQQYRQTIERAKAQAAQAADLARKSISAGSLLAAIALLIGAVASWFGGRSGAVDPTITRERLRTLARTAMQRTGTGA